MSITLVSCNSSDNGLSDSEKIGLFIDSIAFQSSEDNLVTSIGYEDASLVLKFESNQSESIAQDLVSYELSNFYAKLVFNDSREAEVALINAQISMTAINSIDSNVPLSKKFEVDVPFRGLLSWTTFGRNGDPSNIKSSSIAVEKGLG